MTAVTIDRLSNKGFGIATLEDNREVMVPKTVPGDVVEIEIDSRPHANDRYLYGAAINIIEASPKRVAPICPHFETCGGCPWQMIDYPSQLLFKQQKLKYFLERVGISHEPLSIIAAKDFFAFRNRAQLKSNGKIIGYVKPGTKDLHSIQECPILNSKCQQILKDLLSKLPNEDWIPKPPHSWIFLDIDDEATEIIPNRRLPFRQGNTGQNDTLISVVRSLFNKIENPFPIVELFAGSGNITRYLPSGGDIFAFEIAECKNPYATESIVSNLYKKSEIKKHSKIFKQAKTLVADPPRDGLKNKRDLLPLLSNTDQIILISCSLESMSHDLIYLSKNRFKIREIIPVDFFPHTPHLEVITFLERL